MKKQLNFTLVIIVLIMAGCQQDRKAILDQIETEPGLQEVYGLDSIKSPLRKVIRQSDIELQVKNVFKATSSIEKTTVLLNGIVEESSYSSNLQLSKEILYTEDSLLQLSTYIPTSTLRLRVPQQNLDSLLSALPSLAQHISYRNIRQSDATFAFIENGLKKQLNTTTADKINIKKADDAVVAASFGENSINNLIENLKIDDKVAYSTVSIQLTQPGIVERQIISNTTAALQTPFTTSMKGSLGTGLNIAKTVLIFLISLWPLMLIVILYFILKKQKLGFAWIKSLK